MAALLARIFAALRGVAVPSPGGRASGPFEPQVVRTRPDGAADATADRATRVSDFRVKRMRQIAAFYADSSHEAVVTIGDCGFLPPERFHAAAELMVRAAGEPASALIATENAVRKAILKRRLSELTDRERATLR